jgi:hypothetical protein
MEGIDGFNKNKKLFFLAIRHGHGETGSAHQTRAGTAAEAVTAMTALWVS